MNTPGTSHAPCQGAKQGLVEGGGVSWVTSHSPRQLGQRGDGLPTLSAQEGE